MWAYEYNASLILFAVLNVKPVQYLNIIRILNFHAKISKTSKFYSLCSVYFSKFVDNLNTRDFIGHITQNNGNFQIMKHAYEIKLLQTSDF